MQDKTAIIIGAGPVAYELLARSDIRPVILGATGAIGGISRTIEHNGNRMGFLSKSDRVMAWWLSILPEAASPARDELQLFPERAADCGWEPDPERTDAVMLTRRRLSRIETAARESSTNIL
jgi:hypothetical protein